MLTAKSKKITLADVKSKTQHTAEEHIIYI